jgi:predicted phosphate transport protein (TIGR00153 family)
MTEKGNDMFLMTNNDFKTANRSVLGVYMPLNRIKKLIVPQENIFFELMEKQADKACEAAHALADLLENYTDVQVKVKKIKEIEHQGDFLMRDIYTALNKTFIVPIDHADIATLASALDDVLDLVDQTAILLVAYDIKNPSPAMVQLSKLLVTQTQELKNAVTAITHSHTYNKAYAHCDKIKGCEIKADEEYIRAIAVLFKGNDPIYIMKHKEILDCLETATDQADHAAQHISDIVMKHS